MYLGKNSQGKSVTVSGGGTKWYVNNGSQKEGPFDSKEKAIDYGQFFVVD